ncbi:MAG: CHAT domain-containing protein [Alphaproteobacteria bacterium]|nr:CHAT domain-containing protein [Alphaproteobacteria bacterium]MCB9791298.1 CHAT domain-containing protein [Alphaproteobacteria bacterium]
MIQQTLNFTRAEGVDAPIQVSIADGASATLPLKLEELGEILKRLMSETDTSQVVAARLGGVLRDALYEASWGHGGRNWAQVDQDLQKALSAPGGGVKARLCIRSSLPEVLSTPWELLLLHGDASPLGFRAGMDLRYQRPGDRALPAPPSGGVRCLYAWAGDDLPALAEQVRGGLQETLGDALQVLPQVSVAALREGLGAARDAGAPAGVLHLLCHGRALPGQEGWGLQLNEADGLPVTGGKLAAALEPFRSTLQLVVLSVCNANQSGRHLHGVAEALRAQGIQAVVACRVELHVLSAVRYAEVFYRHLRRDGVAVAHIQARQELALSTSSRFDWAYLQLLAGPEALGDPLGPPPVAAELPAAPPPVQVPTPPPEGEKGASGTWRIALAAVVGLLLLAAVLRALILWLTLVPQPDLRQVEPVVVAPVGDKQPPSQLGDDTASKKDDVPSTPADAPSTTTTLPDDPSTTLPDDLPTTPRDDPTPTAPAQKPKAKPPLSCDAAVAALTEEVKLDLRNARSYQTVSQHQSKLDDCKAACAGEPSRCSY